jgi:hypothetical protein
MSNITNEYETARGDYQKAVAALSLSRRKQNPAHAWEWAALAANHAASLGIGNPRNLLGASTWPELGKLDDAVSAKRKDEILIVTRHAGFVEWLDRRGITGRVIERATPSDVLGMHCIGNLPEQLKAIAASFSRIAIPGCPPDRRQEELTADELDEYGAFLRTYTVKEIPAIQP